MNLSHFGDGEFKIFKLSLKNCKDPDAYIEVALKGTFTSEKPREHRGSQRTSANPQATVAPSTTLTSQKTGGEEDELEKEQVMNIL